MPLGRWNGKLDEQSTRVAGTKPGPEATDRLPPEPEASDLPDVTPELVDRLEQRTARSDGESAMSSGALRGLVRLFGVSPGTGRTETDAPHL